MSKEAMKLALDALIAATPVRHKDPHMQAAAIVALEEELAKLAEQPAPVKQKPVGYVCFEGDEVVWTGDPPESGTVLYATSQAPKENT